MNPRTVKIGSDEERKLTAVAKMLKAVSPNNYDYEVENVYFDYGQNWMWTTIICHNYLETGTLSSWQAVSPRQWSNILEAETVNELCKVTNEIRDGKFFMDK